MILISQVLLTCTDKYGLKLPVEADEDEELEGTPAAKLRKTPKKQSTTKSECHLFYCSRVVDPLADLCRYWLSPSCHY